MPKLQSPIINEELQLPAIDEDVLLSDAYDLLKASGKSGLVVRHADGLRLFTAKSLEIQLPNRSREAMRNIIGGTWLPDRHPTTEQRSDYPSAFLLELTADSAIVGGLSPEVSRDLNFRVQVYCCSEYPKIHIYTGTEYRALPVVNGIRYCSTKDGGVVS